MTSVIGLDIGRHSVKIVVRGPVSFRTRFPSMTLPAYYNPGTQNSFLTREDTVEVNGSFYHFGETACLQRNREFENPKAGFYSDWVSTPHYEALLRGALKKTSLNGSDLDNSIIVLGAHQTDIYSQKNFLEDLLRKVSPSSHGVIRSHPQGIYYRDELDETGHPVRDDLALHEKFIYINVGYFRTDYALINASRIIKSKSGSTIGFFQPILAALVLIAEDKESIFDYGKIISISSSQLLEAIDKDSKTILIKYFGCTFDVTYYVKQAVSHWFISVFDALESSLSTHIGTTDKIVVAGGGAPFLHPLLTNMWPNVNLLDDPIFSSSDGFSRIGMMMSTVPDYKTRSERK